MGLVSAGLQAVVVEIVQVLVHVVEVVQVLVQVLVGEVVQVQAHVAEVATQVVANGNN